MHKVVPFGSCCSENSSSIPTNWFHGFLTFSVCHLKVPDHVESKLLMAENKPLIVETIFFCMFKLHPNFRSASLTLESRGKIGRSQDKVQPLCALCTRFMSFAQQLGAGQETCGATRVCGWAMVTQRTNYTSLNYLN